MTACILCHGDCGPDAITAHCADGSATWCSDTCAALDGWPDDIGAVRRAMARTEAGPVPTEAAAIPPEVASRRVSAAGESPAPTPRTIPMPRQELRIDIRVPLSGDVFADAPMLTAVGTTLNLFRAALADENPEATITHEMVTPRPRGARG